MNNAVIDFTDCKINKFKAYGGGNGAKISVVYEGKSYMLKFNSRKNIVYSNNNCSEYIACHIFQSLGISAQNTLLGVYRRNNKTSYVVACEDFNQNGYQLMEFAKLKNTCIESSKSGYGIELQSVLDAIDEQTLVPAEELKKFFWDMFIADAFVGNFDRHNGNWGLLINEQTEDVKIAPVYDCGSCLYPQLQEKNICSIMNNEDEINQRIYVFPNSAVKINNIKINYFDYISSLQNDDCTKALIRIARKIDMTKVAQIIDGTPFITDMRKAFLKMILKARKEKILDYSLAKAAAQK